MSSTQYLIANGASVSAGKKLNGLVITGFLMPSGWTAAGLSFEVSEDDSSYVGVFDDAGAQITLTVAASEFIVPTNMIRILAISNMGLYLRLRSGTTAVPVNQGADRTINVIGSPP